MTEFKQGDRVRATILATVSSVEPGEGVWLTIDGGGAQQWMLPDSTTLELLPPADPGRRHALVKVHYAGHPTDPYLFVRRWSDDVKDDGSADRQMWVGQNAPLGYHGPATYYLWEDIIKGASSVEVLFAGEDDDA